MRLPDESFCIVALLNISSSRCRLSTVLQVLYAIKAFSLAFVALFSPWLQARKHCFFLNLSLYTVFYVFPFAIHVLIRCIL